MPTSIRKLKRDRVNGMLWTYCQWRTLRHERVLNKIALDLHLKQTFLGVTYYMFAISSGFDACHGLLDNPRGPNHTKNTTCSGFATTCREFTFAL